MTSLAELKFSLMVNLRTSSEIVKPDNDKRDYRMIELENYLKILLISDHDTDKCAASMNVSVGYFSDPQGLEGLAHLLEHMLFYASEKYPEGNSYRKYIIEHGGNSNAHTDKEETIFHFDVNANCFYEALDRFAQFFIKPLLSADATIGEIKIVNSENQINLLSDDWRMQQLQKHLTKEDHPYHKFNTGNTDTLQIRPQEKGVDTRTELVKFYKEHYSANIMHLVVYGKESLDQIQDIVEKTFQEIPNTNKVVPRFPVQPCTADHLQILVKSVPIERVDELVVSWLVPSNILHYEEAPSKYFGHLIDHEGKGSLFHVLKNLEWAGRLFVSEEDCTSDYSFFMVWIRLTEAGHQHVEEVLGLLFKYIQLLRETGVCQRIFDEFSALRKIKFDYQDKAPPVSYIVDIASNMRIYPTKDWLVGSSLPTKFDATVLKNFLNELSPENLRIFWESWKFQGQTNKIEPWYNTAYSLVKITSSTIQACMQSARDVEFHLPVPNVFIPTDFSLKHFEDKNTVPILLKNWPFARLWYKPDTMFSLPKAYVKMDFNCPLAVSSPVAVVLTDMFVQLLMDYLNEYAYDAQVAGVHYGVKVSHNGFILKFHGFNDKLETLIETVIKEIANFEVLPQRFSVIKDKVSSEYLHPNHRFQEPYLQALYYCSLILQEQIWPMKLEDKTSHCTVGSMALSGLVEEDLAKFVPMLLSRTFIECYVAGNVTRDEARSMVELVQDDLFFVPHNMCLPLFSCQHLTNRVVNLEKGTKYFYHKENSNSSDRNSILLHYIQVHRDDVAMNIKLQLFCLVAKTAAFHQLRTVDNLGYIVELSPRNDSGIYGLQFIIQSSDKGPGYIESKVESFLKNFESTLCEMSDEYFESTARALRTCIKFKNLKEESRFYWGEIQRGTFKFNKEAEVAALKQLQKQDLIDFFNEHIKVGAARKRSLSIRVYGSQHLDEMPKDIDEVRSQSVVIKDIVSFRNSQPLHGSFRGCEQPELSNSL